MLFKNNKIISYSLIVTYILLIIIVILSLIQGGTTKTGSGIVLPDSWMYIPFFFFAIITVIQCFIYHRQKSNLGISIPIISTLKLLFVLAIELINDHYVFDPTFPLFESEFGQGFNSNIWIFMLVVLFLSLLLIISILEIAGWFILRRQQKKTYVKS